MKNKTANQLEMDSIKQTEMKETVKLAYLRLKRKVLEINLCYGNISKEKIPGQSTL